MTVSHDDRSLPISQSRPYKSTIPDSCICALCLCTISSIISGVVFLNFILNMVQGKNLYPEIPTVKIESITVSNSNLSNPIFAHWNINMSMHNNKSSFEFSDSAISVFHQEEVLWMARLQGFDMRPKNTTVHFALDLGRIIKIKDSTVRAIGDRIINNHGAVEFNVQFKADHPTGRNINPLWKFFNYYETKVKMLIISCDVLLLFGSPDKTGAYMLMTNNQACRMHVYPSFRSLRVMLKD